MEYKLHFYSDVSSPETDVLEVPSKLRGVLRLSGLIEITSNFGSEFIHEFGENIALVRPPIPSPLVESYKDSIESEINSAVSKNEEGATVRFTEKKRSRVDEEMLARPLNPQSSDANETFKQLATRPRRSFLDYGDELAPESEDTDGFEAI